MVQCYSGQNLVRNLSQQQQQKKSWLCWCMPVTSAIGGRHRLAKRAGGVTHMVECLLSKLETLGLYLSTATQKELYYYYVGVI
jgi:hypothetical protein